MKKLLLIIFITTFVSILSAKTIPCRSGEVLNAEFTTTKPEIMNFNKNLFGKDSAKYYAAVAIRLSNKRTISIFDYNLKVGADIFPTVAIQKNYLGFEYTNKTLSPDNENDVFILLFFVDSQITDRTLELQANFQPSDMAKIRLPFKNLNNGVLSNSTLINYNGNF